MQTICRPSRKSPSPEGVRRWTHAFY